MVLVPFYNPTTRAQRFQLLHDLHFKDFFGCCLGGELLGARVTTRRLLREVIVRGAVEDNSSDWMAEEEGLTAYFGIRLDRAC